MESIVRYMNNTYDDLKDILKSIYGNTINIETRNGIIVIHGLVENVMQTIYINDDFYKQAKYIRDQYLYDENETYALNGEKYIWLYDIMRAFENSTNVNVTRYKGIGEMNPSEFAKTTLNPENRTLIQYTFDNMKEDLEKLKFYSTSKGKKVLIKDSVARRIDLLG